jgi:hypothetical protein
VVVLKERAVLSLESSHSEIASWAHLQNSFLHTCQVRRICYTGVTSNDVTRVKNDVFRVKGLQDM